MPKRSTGYCFNGLKHAKGGRCFRNKTDQKPVSQYKGRYFKCLPDDKYIKEAIKNGASGYILKSQSTDTIIECLKIIGKGNTVFNDNVAQCIPTMLKEEKTRDLRDFDLTKREMEILALVGEGLNNKEIAEKLFLSEGTVRNNITLLLDKLNLRDRTQLALFYVNNFEHGQYLNNR